MNESQELPELTLGVLVKIDDKWYMPVRICDQSTLFEDHKTGATFIDEEKYWELRDKDGVARFIVISTKRHAAMRSPGPCKGIMPYFWKGAPDGNAQTS